MCNTEECAGPYEDFRAQQCIQRSNKYHKNIKHTWLPYEHPDGKSVRSTAKPAPSFKGVLWISQGDWLHSREKLLSSIFRRQMGVRILLEDIRNNHGWVVFGDFRGAKMWDELQVEGDRRGGVHEPGDARRDPLQLLGALQSVRPRRVSGASATLTLEVHADTNTTHAVF